MSYPSSATPSGSMEPDADRLRILMDNLNNLRSRLKGFTVVDSQGQAIGQVKDLLLDSTHQLNVVIEPSGSFLGGTCVLLDGRQIQKVSVQAQSVSVDVLQADLVNLPRYAESEVETDAPDLAVMGASSLGVSAGLGNNEGDVGLDWDLDASLPPTDNSFDLGQESDFSAIDAAFGQGLDDLDAADSFPSLGSDAADDAASFSTDLDNLDLDLGGMPDEALSLDSMGDDLGDSFAYLGMESEHGASMADESNELGDLNLAMPNDEPLGFELADFSTPDSSSEELAFSLSEGEPDFSGLDSAFGEESTGSDLDFGSVLETDDISAGFGDMDLSSPSSELTLDLGGDSQENSDFGDFGFESDSSADMGLGDFGDDELGSLGFSESTAIAGSLGDLDLPSSDATVEGEWELSLGDDTSSEADRGLIIGDDAEGLLGETSDFNLDSLDGTIDDSLNINLDASEELADLGSAFGETEDDFSGLDAAFAEDLGEELPSLEEMSPLESPIGEIGDNLGDLGDNLGDLSDLDVSLDVPEQDATGLDADALTGLGAEFGEPEMFSLDSSDSDAGLGGLDLNLMDETEDLGFAVEPMGTEVSALNLSSEEIHLSDDLGVMSESSDLNLELGDSFDSSDLGSEIDSEASTATDFSADLGALNLEAPIFSDESEGDLAGSPLDLGDLDSASGGLDLDLGGDVLGDVPDMSMPEMELSAADPWDLGEMNVDASFEGANLDTDLKVDEAADTVANLAEVEVPEISQANDDASIGLGGLVGAGTAAIGGAAAGVGAFASGILGGDERQSSEPEAADVSDSDRHKSSDTGAGVVSEPPLSAPIGGLSSVVPSASAIHGEFNSPKDASYVLGTIAKTMNHRCKHVKIEVELEDPELQASYQDWINRCMEILKNSH